MPKAKTKFQEHWLKEKDRHGHLLCKWCVRGKDEHHALCLACNKQIGCDNAGLSQVKQHAETQGHVKLFKSTSDYVQSRIILQPQSSSSTKSSLGISIINDDVTAAEVIWAGKSAVSNYSFRSSDGIAETFQAMFKCPIAEKMTLSRTKMSYLYSDGLGPVFREEMVADLVSSGGAFSLQYDETTKVQVKKQMDLLLRYWSTEHNEVWCRYFKSLFFGHARGEVVAEALMKSMKFDNVPISKMVALGSDGPNVNKTIWREMEKRVKDEGNNGLIDIGTCNVHVIHNAFAKGLSEYGGDVEQLAVDLFSLFKYSAARREDFKEIQLDLELEIQMFHQHTNTRWLSIGPSIRRILDQWTGICQFIDSLQKDSKSAPKSIAFRRTATALGPLKQATRVQLHFLDCTVKIFEEFLRSFQSKEPMVHRLYDDMCALPKTLLLRFIKPEKLKGKDGVDLASVDLSRSHQLSDDDISIGESARKALVKLTMDQLAKSLLGMRECFCAIASYLKTRLPLDNRILKCLGFLNPQKTNIANVEDIAHVARKFHLPDSNIVTVKDEWKVLCFGDDMKLFSSINRVDHFWREIFMLKRSDGQPKYPCLTDVIKTALVIPHGNADVERGLSVNNSFVTAERSLLSETVINGVRATKDMVQFCDPELNRPEKLPLTKKIITAARGAHSEYVMRLEADRKREEEEKQRKQKQKAEIELIEKERQQLKEKQSSLQEKEEKLLLKEKKTNDALAAAHELLSDGNNKLRDALKNGNLQYAATAHLMIDTGTQKTRELTTALEEVRHKQRSLTNKKRKLFDKNLSLLESVKKFKPGNAE